MTPKVGDFVSVLHDNRRLVCTVMDFDPKTKTPKRVRIQRGPKQGDVLMPSEYVLLDRLADEDISP